MDQIINSLKNDHLVKLIWHDSDEFSVTQTDIHLASSISISDGLQLHLIKKNGNLFLKFEEDTGNKFLINIIDDTDAKIKLDFYTNKNTKQIKWQNEIILFGGLIDGMIELENDIVFNEYFKQPAVRRSTDSNTEQTSPLVSGYRTKYSNTLVIFVVFDSIDNVCPFIVFVNSPYQYLPKDVVAALKRYRCVDTDLKYIENKINENTNVCLTELYCHIKNLIEDQDLLNFIKELF